MSKRTQWITHKGTRILFADFTNLRDEGEYIKAFDELENDLLSQPAGRMVPTLLDVSNSMLSTAITDRSKKMTQAAEAKGIPNSPSAIYGMTGFQKAVVQAMQFFRKDIYIASSLEAGKDWLVEQMKK